MVALRRGFEKEVTGARERHEKDLGTKKGAWELEMITTKVGSRSVFISLYEDAWRRYHELSC